MTLSLPRAVAIRSAVGVAALAVALAVLTALTPLTLVTAAGVFLAVLFGLVVATALLTPIVRRQRAVLARVTRESEARRR